ncbi:MAG: T9SS type A sorting domain-containing protein [Ignavibacteria bacterium]
MVTIITLFTRNLLRVNKTLSLVFFLLLIHTRAFSQVTVSGSNGANGTYATLGAAFAAINGNSQTGMTITITITGNTTETATATLNAGAWNSITISPSGGSFTISGNIDGVPLINFNGADFVTIDGLNTGGNYLTISNTSTSNTSGTSTIKFINDAIRNTVQNCSVLGSATVPLATNGGNIFISTAATGGRGNDSITISNCKIGPAGTNLPSKGIYANGSTTNSQIANSNIVVKNCEIYDYFLTSGCAGIYILTGNTDWTIQDNKFYETATRTFTAAGTWNGIYFSNATYGNNIIIRGNIIGYSSNSQTGTLTLTGSTVAGSFQGIYLNTLPGATNPCIINKNIISDISLTSSTGTLYGIYNNTTASSNTINIDSNIVRNIATYTTTGAHCGIYAGSATTLTVNNNTIDNITRTGNAFIYGIQIVSPTNVTMNYNTISNLAINSATSTASIYGIYSLSSAVNVTGNYNNIFNISTTSTSSVTLGGIREYGVADNKTFQNNNIYNFSTAGPATFYGIYVSIGTVNISGNQIFKFRNYVSGSFYGIYDSSTTTSVTHTIANNTVKNLYTANGGATAMRVYGIYGLNSTSSTSNCYGNMVDSLVNTGRGAIYGIYFSTNQYLNVYGNTVRRLRSEGTGASGQVLAIYLSSEGTTTNCYQNTINSLYDSRWSIFGIYSKSGVTTNIYKNNLYDFNAPQSGSGGDSCTVYGICTGSSTGSSVTNVYNNFISDFRWNGTRYLGAGLYLFGSTSGTTHNYFYNTVYLQNTGTGATTVSLYANTTPTLDLRNNILVNTSSGGYAIGISRSSTTLTTYSGNSNNNCIYSGTPGPNNLIYSDGTNSDQTIAQYRARVAPRDGASFSENPPFVNISSTPYNLHLRTDVPTLCESGGTRVTSPIAITTDYDDDIRWGESGYTGTGTAVDIGADEFNGIPIDLVPPTISYTLLTNTSSTTNRTLSNFATITDASGVNTTSGTAPRIYYKRSTDANTFNDNTSLTNGWKWTEATNTSSPFSFTIDYSLLYGGGGVTVGDVVQYFVVAQDLATTPNVGINSGVFANPQASVNLQSNAFPIGGTINSYTIVSSPLAGTYTVGLSMFNKVTGKNLYYQTFTRIVKREVTEMDGSVNNTGTQKDVLVNINSTSRVKNTKQNIGFNSEKIEKESNPLTDNLQKTDDRTSIDKISPDVGIKKENKGQDVMVTRCYDEKMISNSRIRVIEVVEEYSVLMENGKPYTGPDAVIGLRNGIGTADSPNGVYTTITAAINDLNNRGVSGVVTFLLVDATYTGETLPLVINVINEYKPTSNNTVTIKPNTGISATVSGSVNNGAILKIYNTDYIIIDGSNSGGTSRDLTISNTSSTSPNVIWVGSSGTTPISNITVKNCILNNGANTSSAVVISDGGTVGNPGYFNNITIQNNQITKAYIGVYANGGTSPQQGSNLSYINNTLTSSGTDAIKYSGLYMQGVNGATVKGNVVANFESTSGEDDRGIWLASGTINATVERNNIYTLKYTGTGGYGSYGIAVTSVVSSCNDVIKNNLIYDISGDGWDYTSILTDNPMGIYLGGGTQTGVKIYNNSIYLSGNTLNQTSALSMGICLATGSTAEIRNNVIVNNLGLLSTTGYGATGIYLQSGISQLEGSDYNDIYVNPTGSGVKLIGKVSTTDYATLSAWRTATGQERLSITGDPGFTSTTNLQPDVNNVNCWNIHGKGYPISSVTDDYAGNGRSTSVSSGAPDIGAYEFTPSVTPSDATQSGTISDGNTTSYTVAGNVIAVITWHGTNLPTSLSAKYYSGVWPSNTPGGAQYSNVYFDLTPTGGSGYTYDLTLYYTPGLIGTISGENYLRLAHYTGGSWNQHQTEIPNTTNKSITVNGLSSFSAFAFGDANAPLPLLLSGFSGRVVNQRDVEMKWKTVKEYNNRGFEIERTISGKEEWKTVDFVKGMGTKESETEYMYVDRKLNTGKYRYRLKQIDNNGYYSYYDMTEEMEIGLPGKYDISQNYPNPFNPVTKIDYGLPYDSRVEIMLYDITGREIKKLVSETQKAGYYTLEVNGMGLASGVYFYRIMAEGNGNRYVMTKKMMLVK